MLMLLGFIIIRVGYIQVVEYEKLNKLAKSLWNRNLPIEANRALFMIVMG